MDIGAGSCNIAEVLGEAGFSITPLYLRNLSFVPQIAPVIYDGQHIPFADKSFDVTLLVFMLHRTGEPEAIIKEASRVAADYHRRHLSGAGASAGDVFLR